MRTPKPTQAPLPRHSNAALRRLESTRTRANTRLPAWARSLDAALAARGLPESTVDDAVGFYETGHSPETAAAEIAAR